ncbi:MAG TPA: hypothetical protein VFU37_06690 [Pyrinomonadaceae bacterium]|nr:hypothetical protein [Pyrinomonadaceae bacterium]
MNKFHRPGRGVLTIAIMLALATLIPLTQRTIACGPFFSDAIFVFTKHPDFPLENFAAGKFGVINKSWARSYLVVVYRSLSGNPLSDREARAMKSLWDERLNNSSESSDDSWRQKWNEARKTAGAPEVKDIEVYRNREKPHEYESFLNCQPDAFVNAASLLNERVKLFGAGSPQVNAWLAAQDAVFANCKEGKHIPEPAGSNDETLVRADRAYQTAAANFYSTNFDEATQQFEAIARDQQSPYRIIAPYMAARSVLRKGSFAEKEEEGRPFLIDAENRLSAILKDNSLKLSHHAAGRLFNLARLRAHPEEKLHELARLIMKKDASEDVKQNVWDYTVLLDRYLEVETNSGQLPASLKSDDLTDWIMTFEGDIDASDVHALERWRQTKSLPWLVAAMANANGKQPALNELLLAAAQVDHTASAYPAIAFHSVRLLKETNRLAEARTMLDKILANERPQLTASAVNEFLSQRMMLARNLEEFLQNAPRAPAGFSDNYDGREIPDDEKDAGQNANGGKSFFAMDAANIFNKAVPVAMMKDSARSKILPANLRRDVAQAAFARAALLDDHEVAIQAAVALEAELPELKEFLAAYKKALTPDARRFAAAFLSLKFPGLRPFVSNGVGRTTAVDDIDSYRDNYWCTAPPVPLGGAPSGDEQSKSRPVETPDFLSGSKALGDRQYAALQALGTAPNYLCRIAIEWAQKNPNDPRAPEALHLAVRSTRYGCTDKETGRWSKAAFDFLHSRYPNTTWAKNTKYWFK